MSKTKYNYGPTKETVSESLPPAGRNTPAAKAYTNDRRSGKTHPELRENRLLDGITRYGEI